MSTPNAAKLFNAELTITMPPGSERHANAIYDAASENLTAHGWVDADRTLWAGSVPTVLAVAALLPSLGVKVFKVTIR